MNKNAFKTIVSAQRSPLNRSFPVLKCDKEKRELTFSSSVSFLSWQTYSLIELVGRDPSNFVFQKFSHFNKGCKGNISYNDTVVCLEHVNRKM